MSDKLAYSLAHAAEQVDVSLPTLRDAIDRNELVARRVGPKQGAVRIEHSELVRWFRSLPTERTA